MSADNDASMFQISPQPSEIPSNAHLGNYLIFLFIILFSMVAAVDAAAVAAAAGGGSSGGTAAAAAACGSGGGGRGHGDSSVKLLGTGDDVVKVVW
jgi:hypothetical protein